MTTESPVCAPKSPRAVVLVENSPREGLLDEHGLSLHISYGCLRILLDFGQSDAFARNAAALGIDLALVEVAVLSHAHYDHADGMTAFFDRNERAQVHLSEACRENCWSTKGGSDEPHYIGIRQGTLERFADRLSPAPINGTTTIAPGVHLVPHTTASLEELGARAGMLLRDGDGWVPDGFAHEMSLVLELENERLAVLNSCSHAGLPVIAREVRAAFPGRPVATYVGGLHLMRSADEEILAAAEAIRAAGIERLCTGHCTGERALELLALELPGVVTPLRPGLSFAL